MRLHDYKALTFDQPLVNEQSAVVVTADLLRLFQSRIEQYATTTPTRPELERHGTKFLSYSRLWDTKEGKKQRGAIMQQLSNFIGLLAQHASGRPESERKDYTDRLKNAGEALSTLSGRRDVADPGLATAGKKLAEVTPSMGEQDFTERADAAHAAIKVKFPEVKPAPRMTETAVKEPEVEVVEDPDEKDEAPPAPAAGGDGAKDPAPKDAAPKDGAAKDGGAAPRPAPAPAPKPAPPRQPPPTADPASAPRPPAQDRPKLK